MRTGWILSNLFWCTCNSYNCLIKCAFIPHEHEPQQQTNAIQHCCFCTNLPSPFWPLFARNTVAFNCTILLLTNFVNSINHWTLESTWGRGLLFSGIFFIWLLSRLVFFCWQEKFCGKKHEISSTTRTMAINLSLSRDAFFLPEILFYFIVSRKTVKSEVVKDTIFFCFCSVAFQLCFQFILQFFLRGKHLLPQASALDDHEKIYHCTILLVPLRSPKASLFALKVNLL